MDILVIKFGTASITKDSGEPDESIIADLARQAAQLHRTHRIILVSSGAVGAGKASIRKYQGSLTQRKAAAAVGNPVLVSLYARHFAPYGISIAQGLCERRHFADRNRFLQLKDTFETLWKNGIIPVVNENDVVNDRELKFSDNDELATLLAAGFGAKSLLFCTRVGGVLDRDGRLIRETSDIDALFGLVQDGNSGPGLGGMTSKLTFAKLAVRMGIRVVIFGMSEPDGLLRGFSGETGTVFPARRSSLSARMRWLGSGGLTTGRIWIDAGAASAVKKRKSLLSVGICKVEGTFAAGEIVEIFEIDGKRVAGKAGPGGSGFESDTATNSIEIGGNDAKDGDAGAYSEKRVAAGASVGEGKSSGSDADYRVANADYSDEAISADSESIKSDSISGFQGRKSKSQKQTESGGATIPAQAIAVARVKLSSAGILSNGRKHGIEIAHANDIVLL